MGLENDAEFLGYVSLHCLTERALFHREHILRLYKLAKVDPPKLTGDWYTMREDVAAPLLRRAYGFLRLKVV